MGRVLAGLDWSGGENQMKTNKVNPEDIFVNVFCYAYWGYIYK